MPHFKATQCNLTLLNRVEFLKELGKRSQHCCAHHDARVWPACCKMSDGGLKYQMEPLQQCCTNVRKRVQLMQVQKCCTKNMPIFQFDPTPSNILQQIATGWPSVCNILRAKICWNMLNAFGRALYRDDLKYRRCQCSCQCVNGLRKLK